MAQLSKRLNTLYKQLGVPRPEDVFKLFENNSEVVAEIVREALERVLDEVRNRSRSGALKGYSAVKVKADDVKSIRLPRSGYVLPGITEWLVFVQPSPHHESLDLSVFEVLDQGRPEIKNPHGVYPLWGALINVQRRRIGDTRIEPRSPDQRGDIPFTTVNRENWIAEVPARNLYDLALKRAKDKLTIKGLDRQWDVIKVGFD